MKLFLQILLGAVLALPALAQVGDIHHVHDPVLIESGGKFYLYSTNNRILLRTSPDLINWTSVRQTLPGRLPEWATRHNPKAQDYWAPDISYFNGRYHLYYSISEMGSRQSAIGLATSPTLDPSDPDYRWTDRGPIIKSTPSDRFNAIDPNILLDRGQPWLAFGSGWIKLVRIDPKTGKTTGPLYTLAEYSGGIEGPFLIKRGRFYYLFVSFDACCAGVKSTYRTMVGRSTHITGPYRDYQGKPMLHGGGTLVLSGHGPIKGPGHNSIIRHDNQDYIAHHFYDARNQGIPTLQIRPLHWSQDGWPVPGQPVDRELTVQALHVATPKFTHSVNFDPLCTVELLPDGKTNEPGTTWTRRGNTLTLRWRRDGQVYTDQCYFPPDQSYYVGRNHFGDLIYGTFQP